MLTCIFTPCHSVVPPGTLTSRITCEEDVVADEDNMANSIWENSRRNVLFSYCGASDKLTPWLKRIKWRMLQVSATFPCWRQDWNWLKGAEWPSTGPHCNFVSSVEGCCVHTCVQLSHDGYWSVEDLRSHCDLTNIWQYPVYDWGGKIGGGRCTW